MRTRTHEGFDRYKRPDLCNTEKVCGARDKHSSLLRCFLHLLNLVFQHTLDFIAHGFGAGGAVVFWVIFSLLIGSYTPFPDGPPVAAG